MSSLLVMQFAGCSQDGPKPESGTSLTGEITVIKLGDIISVTGRGATVHGNTVSISAAGNYSVSGTLREGQIVVDVKNVTVNLELAGANITNSSGSAIHVKNAGMTNVILLEGTENSLEDGANYLDDSMKAALFSEDSLTISGDGALNVTGRYKHGIAGSDGLTVQGGKITVVSAVTDGFHANDSIKIDGGDISINAASDGIESELDFEINGGALDISAGDDGIHAETSLTVNGGKISVTRSCEGLEGNAEVIINDGEIRLKCDDDSINAGKAMTINGGYIYAECEGDGVDSNGNLTINGGTIIIFSGDNANGPIDFGDGVDHAFYMNGGTVIAAGGNMGVTVSDDSKQHSMWIASKLPAGTLVNVSESSGDETVTFSLVKSASLIFYSSDKLAGNADYTVSTGGTHSGKFVDNVYSGGVYSGETVFGGVKMSAKSVTLGTPGGMGGWNDFGGDGGRR